MKYSVSFIVSAISLMCVACGDDDRPPPADIVPLDAGDSGMTSQCSAFPNNTGCTSFMDMTSQGTVTINFDASEVYDPKCVAISTGTMVTFMGAGGATFASHPLRQACGPTVTITSTTIGGTKNFTFNTPGDYGYFCEVHGSSLGIGMAGMIRVQ